MHPPVFARVAVPGCCTRSWRVPSRRGCDSSEKDEDPVDPPLRNFDESLGADGRPVFPGTLAGLLGALDAVRYRSAAGIPKAVVIVEGKRRQVIRRYEQSLEVWSASSGSIRTATARTRPSLRQLCQHFRSGPTSWCHAAPGRSIVILDPHVVARQRSVSLCDHPFFQVDDSATLFGQDIQNP